MMSNMENGDSDFCSSTSSKTSSSSDHFSLETEESSSSKDSLILVEERLVKEEAKVKAQNDRQKTPSYEEERDNLSVEQRYKKLMELLSTSQIYSDYVKEKIEATEDEVSVLKQKQVTVRKNHRRSETQSKKRKATSRGKGKATKKAKIETLRKFEGQDIPDEQPILLSGGIMRDYQIQGYQWMACLFENDINGILADEMGLGKTIQTIALFCHLIEMGVSGPFIIVAPLSTVPNWVKEFNRFAPQIPTVLYHGSQGERAELRKQLSKSTYIENLDKKIRPVFVTSFEIAINDRVHLAHYNWRFMVVDEGHRLKNRNCRLMRELKMYSSANKLLLTGTPLQNNLSELWSLLNFIMPKIFDDLKVFEAWFDAKELDENQLESSRILQQEKQNQILSTLHQILTPFLLRRVKSDVDMNIPSKKEVLVYCPMTSRQKEIYTAIVNKTISEVVGTSKTDTSPKGRGKRTRNDVDYSIFLDSTQSEKRMLESMDKISSYHKEREKQNSVSAYNVVEKSRTSDINITMKNKLMDLRKATNHPYLIEYPLTEDGMFYKSDQDMIDQCGKLKVLDQMLGELIKRGHKVLIFSQMTKMLDILGDYLELRSISFSRLDGCMKFEDRQDNIDKFNEDPKRQVFLLSTRAGGLGINLTAADTCIIYDSDWNPQQDLQAQDRCHRIGQTKPVMVYRLVTANTIDQKIVERAAAKRKLEKLIIHHKKFKSQDSEGLKKTMEAISAQELLDLLNSKDHAGVINRGDGNAVFSQEELDSLLDRSDMRWAENNKENKSDTDGESVRKNQELFKIIESENQDALSSVKK